MDDGSDDGTAEVVRRLEPILPYRLGYVRQPSAGPANARNTGIREARDDVLFFTGDDIFPRRDLLDANFSADDIKRLRHQPAANKTPFVHTVLQKQHYWARMPTKYRLIGPMDRLKLAPGMN